MWVFPLGAAAVSFVFAAQLLKLWWARPRAHLMAWAVALAMFGLASLAAAAGMLGDWTPMWFRIYYLFGAVVNVPVLGLGTVYLLAGKRTAAWCAAAVAVATVVATVLVFASELGPGATQAFATEGIPAGSQVMSEDIRLLARICSFAGFFVVVGGALWSAWKLAHHRQAHLERLVGANLLIAGGTIVVALGSGFAFYGRGLPFALGLLAGVSLMFSGFLRTRPPVAARANA